MRSHLSSLIPVLQSVDLALQCVQAKFVSGTGDDFSRCSNGSASGYATDSSKLSALVGDDADSSGSGSSPSETSSSGGSEATGDNDDDDNDDDDGGAMSIQAWGTMSSLLTVTAMALLSGALLA